MDGSMVASLSICGTKGSIRSEHIFAAEIWNEIVAIICILIDPFWFFSSFNCLIAWSIISANSLSWSQSLMLISSVAICYGTIQFLCMIQTTWYLFYNVFFEKPKNLYEKKLISVTGMHYHWKNERLKNSQGRCLEIIFYTNTYWCSASSAHLHWGLEVEMN